MTSISLSKMSTIEYKKTGWGNVLVGDPNARMGAVIDRQTYSVAIKTLEQQPAAGQSPTLKLFEPLFYRAVQVELDGPVQWVLINKNSETKALKKTSVKTRQVYTSFLNSLDGLREQAQAVVDAKKLRVTEIAANHISEAKTIQTRIGENSKISEGEIIAILKYAQKNQQEHITDAISSGKEFVSVRPKDSKLARQLLFYKDGRVVIKLNRIEEHGDRSLGRGAFSRIKTGYEITEEKLVAISTTRPRHSSDQEMLIRTEQKYTSAREIRDSHLVAIRGIQMQKSEKTGLSKLTVEMDLHVCNLRTKLAEEEKYSIKQRRQNGLDLLMGFEALHQAGMIYQDGSLENCLIAQDGRLVLADMGAVVAKDSHDKGLVVGTDLYMSPQALKERQISSSEGFDQKNDVWSAGIILYHNLVTDDVKDYFKRPFIRNQADLPENWMLKDGHTITSLKAAASSKTNPKAEMALLIASMLQPTLEKRLTAAEACAQYRKILPRL